MSEPVIRWRYLDILLLAAPAAFLVRFVPGWQSETTVFILSALAIIPLAAWMSRATDALAGHLGPNIGGLLNATFGNAPELIIGFMALSKGLVGVAKASIIGSIIGNILLVLGTAILAGGIRYPHLRFNQTATRVAATSLTLAAIGLIVPTIFHQSFTPQNPAKFALAEVRLSLAIAGVLFATYIFWLVFSLVTHRRLFAGLESADEAEDSPPWPVKPAIIILGTATTLVAVLSEFLAGSVTAACATLGFSELFVGVIVVAIVGNAGEHATAVFAALKNKMDLSLGITIGSSLQIALFVMPVLVFSSHFFGHPLTLSFSIAEVAAVALAIGIVTLISGDGECNWVEGVQLLSVYLILAILFYFLPDQAPQVP